MTRTTTLLAGRIAAEEGMVDELTVRYKTGNSAQNETTGRVDPVMTVRFVTKCKIRIGAVGSLVPNVREDPAAGRVTTELRHIVHIPMDTPEMQPDDVCEVTAVGPDSDPQLLGRLLRVIAPIGQTYATARRFQVEEQIA